MGKTYPCTKEEKELIYLKGQVEELTDVVEYGDKCLYILGDISYELITLMYEHQQEIMESLSIDEDAFRSIIDKEVQERLRLSDIDYHGAIDSGTRL